jgi:peptide subunit release factor RF-3
MDRPALDPYAIIDEIVAENPGLDATPYVWPIGDGDQFQVRATLTS